MDLVSYLGSPLQIPFTLTLFPAPGPLSLAQRTDAAQRRSFAAHEAEASSTPGNSKQSVFMPGFSPSASLPPTHCAHRFTGANQTPEMFLLIVNAMINYQDRHGSLPPAS